MNADGTMTCRQCGIAKPAVLEFFKPAKNTKSGMNARCRQCMRVYHTIWRETHRESAQARRRELYAAKNAEKVKQRVAERLALSPERRAHAAEMERLRHLRHLAEQPLRARASIMRSGMAIRARARGIPFDATTLTFTYMMDWIERTPNCPCCGVAIDYGYKTSSGPSNRSPSIDRYEPERGYVLGNVSLICWRCNNLKRDATPDELESIARWMRAHRAPPQ